MSQTLPKYIKVLDVARWLSEDTKEIWTVERVTRILRQMGLITKVGRINYVRPEELAGAWPEWFELIIERLSQCKTTSNPLVGLSREKGTMKWIRPVSNQTQPCEYEVGGSWSCAPECDNPNHVNRHRRET